MLEFAQMTVSEPPARVLGKWERRALLTYFVFTPPEEEEAVTTMGEGIRAEGGGKQGGGVIDLTHPLPLRLRMM